MKRIGISFVMAAGVLAVAAAVDHPTAAAQTSTTGAVRGRIVDKASKEAVFGATVVVTGPALPGQQAEITDESGAFDITNLPPGVYVLTVYYNDTTFSRPNVLIEVGKQAFVSVPIDTAVSGAEVIEIEGRAPIVDQGSTKTGTTITNEFTSHIPVGRTFGAVIGTAAGSQNDQYGASFGGSGSAENTYIVEGLNTTDTGFGVQSSNLPNEFVEETEVIAGGYNAEFGRSTGGVINVVTKQGSNRLGGSVFGYYTPGGLVAAADHTTREGSAITSDTNVDYLTDVGFELGGPIKKDKLWFHLGYNPSFSKETLSRIQSSQRDTDANGEAVLDACEDTNGDGVLDDGETMIAGDCSPDIDPASGFTVFDEVGRNDMSISKQTHFFTAKINGALSQNHQFQISAFGNPRSVPRDFFTVLGSREAQLYKYDDGAYDASLKWTSKLNDNKTQLDLVAGYHLGYSHQSPYFAGGAASKEMIFTWNRSLSDLRGFESTMGYPGACSDNQQGDPYPGIVNCPVPAADSYGINGVGFLESRDNARVSGNLSVTQRATLVGHHTFKGGLDVEQTGYKSNEYYTGGGIWLQRQAAFDGVPDPSMPGNWDQQNFLILDNSLDPTDPATRPCIGDFSVRDYRATCRVADEHGITADTKNLNLGIYLQDSWQLRPNLTVNAGLRYERQTGYAAKAVQHTISPDGEVIPDVAFTLDNMFAPRIGIIYDPTQEGRAKVFSHWGRFYENVPMDINVRSFGGEIINVDRASTRLASGAPGGACPQALDTTDPTVLDQCAFSTLARQQFGGGTEFIAPSMSGQYMDELIVGAEYELMPDFKMGVNYVSRNLGDVIEDMSTDGGSSYLIGNPSKDFSGDATRLRAGAERMLNDDNPDNDAIAARDAARADQLDMVKGFDKPSRDYRALQVTANQRFSKDTMLVASYTYSRSKGNFPGLYSTETDQLDPNQTSMYDLPELMANRYGPLALDRPHLLKLDGFRQFDLKKAGVFVIGTSFRGQSGIAHNSLGSHIGYGLDESFILGRGTAGRSPFTWQVDVKASYAYKVSKTQSIEGFVDIFNVLDQQDETDADERYTHDVVNPIVGGDLDDLRHAKVLDEDSGADVDSSPVVNRNFGNLNARNAPLSVRLGLRYTF